MSTERDPDEDVLRDASHDAFMAFWRDADTPSGERLWRAYCRAQARYDDYLLDRLASCAQRPKLHALTPAWRRDWQS